MTTAPQTPEPALTVICAWCPDAAQRKAEATARGEVVTHGICRACAETFKRRD